MERNCKKQFPWALALFLVAYIALTAWGVTALNHAQPAPTEPSQIAPQEPDPEEVFRRLFAQPDWAQLYALAGESATEFEGAQAYGIYMAAKVGDKSLTYYQVYTEKPDAYRYLVCLGEEKVAAFTLSGKTEELELFYEPGVGITVETPPEYTVFVNGVALDDRFTIRTAQTKAEGYLPEGVHGQRLRWQRVSGLLVLPQVTAVDAAGEPVELEWDETAHIYRAITAAPAEITAQEAQLAREAAIADAQYAIGAISGTQLKAYFDENSPVYKMLITNPRNLQKYTSASVDENTMTVGQYCRYSDTMFSVNVTLTQNIIRKDGTLKVYRADKTYFFTQINGSYRVTAYTNEHVTELVEQVRLTFVTDSGTVSQMVDARETVILPPAVDVPQGQTLVGWATKSGAGELITMTVRILPDGSVAGALEPMELYPVFQETT